MSKKVWIYGLIMGGILTASMLIMVHQITNNPDFKSNDYLGYAIMLAIFSLIFFGIRDYRNRVAGGAISFAKALKVGGLITLVAGTLYVILWLLAYYLVYTDFIDHYVQHVLHQCTSPEELEAKKEEMDQVAKMYESPPMVVLMTYGEVLIPGAVITLISALILRKKQPEGE